MSTTVSSSKLDYLLESYPKNRFFFLLDAEGHYLEVRAYREDRLWKSPEEHIGRHFTEILPPELGNDRLYHFNKAVESKETQEWCYAHPFRSGWMCCSIQPLPDATGTITEILMQVWDIQKPNEVPPHFTLDLSAAYGRQI